MDFFRYFQQVEKMVFIFVTLNKSKNLVVILLSLNTSQKNNGYFADLEKIKKMMVILLGLNMLKESYLFS